MCWQKSKENNINICFLCLFLLVFLFVSLRPADAGLFWGRMPCLDITKHKQNTTYNKENNNNRQNTTTNKEQTTTTTNTFKQTKLKHKQKQTHTHKTNKQANNKRQNKDNTSQNNTHKTTNDKQNKLCLFVLSSKRCCLVSSFFLC